MGDGSRMRFIDEEGLGPLRGLEGRPPIMPPAMPAIGPEPSGGDRVEEGTSEDALRVIEGG